MSVQGEALAEEKETERQCAQLSEAADNLQQEIAKLADQKMQVRTK